MSKHVTSSYLYEQELKHAHTIMNYWRERGYQIDIGVVNVSGEPQKLIWGIQSSLVNGVPKGAIIDDELIIGLSNDS